MTMQLSNNVQALKDLIDNNADVEQIQSFAELVEFHYTNGWIHNIQDKEVAKLVEHAYSL